MIFQAIVFKEDDRVIFGLAMGIGELDQSRGRLFQLASCFSVADQQYLDPHCLLRHMSARCQINVRQYPAYEGHQRAILRRRP